MNIIKKKKKLFYYQLDNQYEIKIIINHIQHIQVLK